MTTIDVKVGYANRRTHFFPTVMRDCVQPSISIETGVYSSVRL